MGRAVSADTTRDQNKHVRCRVVLRLYYYLCSFSHNWPLVFFSFRAAQGCKKNLASPAMVELSATDCAA